ncbi:protein-L-isoaspartate(D-aspartate) O-methyltransferase [Consotaella salsifontis]|uniref:Protein-L-isoaspartate O-methyltransferase n=1 Tax=Consotaella salsifontis TaxID=1365950 RepID=A0A1T4R432_9HYPH|nr:protein-L-isoaspartate(D-aspartate) O-methyltransferase [Consotaella salsifontis]SKA10822.1 protein-L-isoaspartate(D-aspartate) O-methyltransferase [Consotaella salsifontis]
MQSVDPRDREDLAAFLLRLRSEHLDSRLLAAVEKVPRRNFVMAGVANAYGDASLPIDCGQTMPGAHFAVSLVAALHIEEGNSVLEVGSGSGYVTALLARLGARVASLDRYRRLIAAAGARLKELGLANAVFELEDGRGGYPSMAPYDRIILHGAFDAVPRVFLEQLAAHGYLICAVGPAREEQMLVRMQKVGSRFEREDLRPVRYLPLEPGVATVL